MSKDPEELELEALQRRLDDAFETTRPRRGFEDELWSRMQRRRPVGERLRDLFGGLVAGFREAPAVPLGTLALLLIVVVGIGVVGPNLINLNHNSARSASAPGAGVAHVPGGDFYAPNGKVPTPALHPGLLPAQPEVTAGAPNPAPGIPTPNDLYFGPANLTWTGTFPTDAVQAPVLIYAEPQPGQSDALKGTFGNTAGVSVVTRGSVAQLPLEPTFVLAEQNPGAAAATADPTAAANDFLSAHNALPAWPYSIVVIHRSGSPVRVLYERAFSVQNGDLAYLVDWNGERYGLAVDIDNGRRTATGPLPLGLENVSLPLIPNAQAAQLAVSQAPASTQAISPMPTVNLDKVELVYALAIAGGNGFYEPAYLFTGQFTYNGQIYLKRVLVPLVAASSRS